MALVHDLAEAVVGDITPNDGVSDEEKAAMEREAMGTMTAALGARGEALMALWEEYEAGESAEARLVKDMDKLEMIAQAHGVRDERRTRGGGGIWRSFSRAREDGIERRRARRGARRSSDVDRGGRGGVESTRRNVIRRRRRSSTSRS